MDQVGRFVADAVLGIDTLWGGDVMCASGTGRFIADSWFADEPLPPAYTKPSAARVRETGGVGGKAIDRTAIETYLREVNLPSAISGVRGEAEKIGGLRGKYLTGLADSLHVMWDLAIEILGKGRKLRVTPMASVKPLGAAVIALFDQLTQKNVLPYLPKEL